MRLSGILEGVQEIPTVRMLLERLASRDGALKAHILEAAKPSLIAALHDGLKTPVLVLCPRPETARELYEQLLYWCPEGTSLHHFPEPGVLPHERLPADPATIVERVKALSILSRWMGKGVEKPIDIMFKEPLVVTSVPALMPRTLAPAQFLSHTHRVQVGMVANPSGLIAQWEAMGYRLEPAVEVPGTMSQRGGIVDIFPSTSSLPTRVEFAGNYVESLRIFDPVNQRSMEVVQSMVVAPARESLGR
jgi:transcription-repair coupling factor (superfamily II helicase)